MNKSLLGVTLLATACALPVFATPTTEKMDFYAISLLPTMPEELAGEKIAYANFKFCAVDSSYCETIKISANQFNKPVYITESDIRELEQEFQKGAYINKIELFTADNRIINKIEPNPDFSTEICSSVSIHPLLMQISENATYMQWQTLEISLQNYPNILCSTENFYTD